MEKDGILRCFGIVAEECGILPVGNGHINDTFKAVDSRTGRSYILQRINHNVFRDVDLLQENIGKVTAHIRRKLEASGETDIDRKVLTLVKRGDSEKTYLQDGDSYWRVELMITDAETRESVTQENARHAGVAFGRFQEMLSDMPDVIGESIPDFHNMELRLLQLDEAVKADVAGRLGTVRELLYELRKRAEHACLAERLYREGRLSKRICHCDTKVSNMLFDSNGSVLCVIDLDTVMPSFVFSDFGDFLRTAANNGDEDDRDLDRVEFDMDIYRAFTEGYLEGAGGFLTETEIANLPYAAERFAYMQAVRFLTDYLNGDTYYRISYPDHNLVRARAQFKLLQSIEGCLPEMAELTDRLASKYAACPPGKSMPRM